MLEPFIHSRDGMQVQRNGSGMIVVVIEWELPDCAMSKEEHASSIKDSPDVQPESDILIEGLLLEQGNLLILPIKKSM